ncbi:transcription factor 20-like [Brachionus plicatilis]|uniref:Transcription factor 20-like n=1 Tax=Brachionus plicatilis TaxID=10195 RepID=A0A3M7Q0V3_BRAPC|nr:transcription factor 20-like [Brachionus plicatilis]
MQGRISTSINVMYSDKQILYNRVGRVPLSSRRLGSSIIDKNIETQRLELFGMSTGPVARWLDTFVYNSKQYAEIFKKFGVDNLNEVCKLDPIQLSNMGVNSADSEKIMENIFVLRQTLQVSKMSSTVAAPAAHQKPARKSKAKGTKQQAAAPNVTINQGTSNFSKFAPCSDLGLYAHSLLMFD